jgi:hypothetical protein
LSGVREFIKHFVRDQYGQWRCISPASIELPSGRIQVTPGLVFAPGTKFMNVDLGSLLDEQAARDRG